MTEQRHSATTTANPPQHMRLFTDPSTIEALPVAALPQPQCCAIAYRYIHGDRILEKRIVAPFTEGQNVWVCLSKGQRRSDTVQSSGDSGTDNANGQRCKLFMRASVQSVDENDDRVTVQYPQGSVYRVRRELLLHILDETVTSLSSPEIPNGQGPLVLVFAETSDYRRACVVHTGPHETFGEIGCASGITCQRVQQHGAADRIVFGLDKSESEIQKAIDQVPHCTFLHCDVLLPTDKWLPELATAIHCKSTRVHEQDVTPTVVAIDINGNRELQAVLSCVQVVMDVWQPRLIVVKSRSLYHGFAKER